MGIQEDAQKMLFKNAIGTLIKNGAVRIEKDDGNKMLVSIDVGEIWGRMYISGSKYTELAPVLKGQG